jgi:hypothetical protein
MELITADDARLLAIASQQRDYTEQLSYLAEEIRKASERGETQVAVRVTLRSEVRTELESAGYLIERLFVLGGDQYWILW